MTCVRTMYDKALLNNNSRIGFHYTGRNNETLSRTSNDSFVCARGGSRDNIVAIL